MKWRSRTVRIVKIVPGVENIVPQKFKERSVNAVRSGLSCHVHKRGCLAAELCRILGFLNLEFFYGVDRRTNNQVVEIFVSHLNAVEKINIVATSLACDINHVSGLLHGRTTRARRRLDNTVAEQRQIHELA